MIRLCVQETAMTGPPPSTLPRTNLNGVWRCMGQLTTSPLWMTTMNHKQWWDDDLEWIGRPRTETTNGQGDGTIIYRFIYYTNSSCCIIILHNLMNLDDHEFFLPDKISWAWESFGTTTSISITCCNMFGELDSLGFHNSVTDWKVGPDQCVAW